MSSVSPQFLHCFRKEHTRSHMIVWGKNVSSTQAGSSMPSRLTGQDADHRTQKWGVGWTQNIP